MNNFLHYSTNISISLSKIERAKAGGVFIVMGMCFELL